MSNTSDRVAPDLARFRSYLRLLAAMQLDPRLAGKVDPSDVAQDTLLEAYQSLDTFKGPECALPAWLRGILRHNLLDALRRYLGPERDVGLERSLHESSERLEQRLRGPDSTPEECALREEALLRLAGALYALPGDQRTAIELKHLRGWSVAQVGEHMGRSEAAVAGLLRRGMADLRLQLAHLM
jgi:RNA polymerase sigma-70 factor, ECF subfamily